MASTCTQYCYSDGQRLLSALSSNPNYSSAIFPNRGTDQFMIVYVNFILVKLMQLSTSGTFNVVGSLSLYWLDPRLAWNRTSYNGVLTLDIPTKHFWAPRLHLINGVSESLAIEFDQSSLSGLTYDGGVALSLPRAFYATCPINLLYFPFDSQKCTLTIGNMDLVSKQSEMMLFYPLYTTADTEMYSSGGEFTLLSSNITTGFFSLKQLKVAFPIVNISFHFTRNPSYYVANVAVPSVLLLFSSGLIFFLPSDNNVKIAMACSLMVALYILQQAVSRLLPTTPTVPLLAAGIMIELGLGCYSVFCAILTVALRTMQPRLCPCCVKLIKALERVFYGAPRKTKVAPANVIEVAQVDENSKTVVESVCGGHLDDVSDPLADAIGSLVDTLTTITERAESHQSDLSEHIRHWKIIDAILNGFLFSIYLIVGIVSCVVFLFNAV